MANVGCSLSTAGHTQGDLATGEFLWRIGDLLGLDVPKLACRLLADPLAGGAGGWLLGAHLYHPT